MPQQQNYKNHIRFYPPHHFVFYPLGLVLAGVAVWQSVINESSRFMWIFCAIIIALIIWVAFMLRQHYALTLQNRLILLELRYRYFVVTGQRLEPMEEQLSEGKLFALRFAPDDELPALVSKAVNENLSPDAIKQAIKNWKADHRRV